MRSIIHLMGVSIAALIATSGPGLAQTQSMGGTGRYEQHNLGPTGCDIVIQGSGKNAQRSVHFDEGQRQFVGGQMVACRNGKIVDANAPPPRPSGAPSP